MLSALELAGPLVLALPSETTPDPLCGAAGGAAGAFDPEPVASLDGIMLIKVSRAGRERM